MLSRSRLVFAAAFAVCGLVLLPAGASALTQSVSGTGVSSVALSVPVTATFGTALQANSSPTTTGGSVSVVDTNATWTLNAGDATPTTGDGHMKAAAVGCTNSESELASAILLTAGAAVPANANIVPAAQVTVPASSASAALIDTGNAPTALEVIPTTFQQVIGSTEALTGLCVYSMTVAYTLG